MDDDDDIPTAILTASTYHERKWAPVVLLGPVMPVLLAVVIVIFGRPILKERYEIVTSEDIVCGYPIDTFVLGAIITSHLLLAIFAWTFLGFETHFTIRGRRRRLLRPFSSLAVVGFVYTMVFLLSLGVWTLGTWAVAKDLEGQTCRTSNPVLYSFSMFLVITYWVGIFFGVVALVRITCGKKIISGAQAQVEKAKQYGQNKEEAEVARAEELLAIRKFNDLDEEGVGSINNDQFEDLVQELAMGLNSKKLKKALAKLDPNGEGRVERVDFIQWYKEVNKGG
ncbi:unnamed protein product [Choristocarpus tenellus]